MCVHRQVLWYSSPSHQLLWVRHASWNLLWSGDLLYSLWGLITWVGYQFIKNSLLEISCSQEFQTLTYDGLKRRLVLTKLTGCFFSIWNLHIINMRYNQDPHSWNNMFARFQNLTSDDLAWPLPSLYNITHFLNSIQVSQNKVWESIKVSFFEH